MWRTNKRIGFDDRLITIIGVAVGAFIIPIVFFGLRFAKPPYFTWNAYITTLIITAVVWLGNRYIMIWSRYRYPQFSDVRRRLMVQSLAMLIFTLLANNILGYLLDGICGLREPGGYPGHSLSDIILNSNAAALFCTLTAVAIYEGISSDPGGIASGCHSCGNNFDLATGKSVERQQWRAGIVSGRSPRG